LVAFRQQRLTPEVLAAFDAGDEYTPLPSVELEGPSPETCWALSWPDALEIRREILAAIRSDKK
jgi:hypothetical protein